MFEDDIAGSLFPPDMRAQAILLLDAARNAELTIATAESCTGGLVSAVLTEIPGSSDVMERGFVTYSNEAKQDLLGVTKDLLDDFGAVSEPVARAMAEGALRACPADLSVAITGVAGPSGGSAAKPVGLVHFAVARRNQPTLAVRHVFTGNRATIRTAAARMALALLGGYLGV